ncbi:glycosyltransferase [Azospirillum soli]|uniref:glycosyltransferase n=1 Tax=Azospirillum soli TaxID=1304799 RepID=UPI001AE8E769|nr:glycosyltransferase [Azospirillum soli]MBP2312246.1 putative colanic acid biosynthesis glycosyltransferase [Azospirillum soli]
MTGRLAILTVVRDDLPGLLATRASLRAQRWRDFDWIVVDGASVDGTAEWLAAHVEEFTWWRSAPDRGLYDAMNVALEAVTASHVLFLNAGDTLAGPEAAGRIAEAIARAPHAGLLYGDALERLSDGRVVAKPARSHRLAVFGMFTHHQAMIYRRLDVAEVRFDLRYALAADYAFTLEVLKRGKAVRLDFPVCVFAPDGRSQQDAARGRAEQAEIRRDMMGHGALATATLSGIQWLALTIRRHIPGLYAKLRFRSAATSCLS